MKPVVLHGILLGLRSIMDSGDPLPISWVISNGDVFPSAWARSADPELMFDIAGYVVPREQLVIATCAVARTALRFVPDDELRPLRAIEAAEAWARGEATKEEVQKAAEAVFAIGRGPDVDSATAAAFDSAFYASRSIRDADYAGVAASYTALAAANASVKSRVSARAAADRKSTVIIRKHIHITVADLVRAGKEGWHSH